ncbi:MAG TPA: M24 family metallopeptidase, partial [Candidatus Nitrosotenuis sp.]|nr:M24 family metallopeptidase [Candidatus Nitrosotenuis sp.]
GRLDPRLVATLPVLDPVSAHEIRALLGRDPEIEAEESPDGRLARAVVEVRLGHDEAALAELEKAARLSVEAHRAGAWATRPGHGELAVLAAMQAICTAAGASFAFQPIVSVDGHVLHNPHYHGRLQEGDLLLVDLGAETPAGWAGDITRTWPVSGRFSGRQRQIYEIVYEAARQAAARLAPGVRFRDVHLEACRVLALGLVEAGLLRGNADSLVERGAHALFFPHGLGHLVGLDVHDMEDLGDLAGYPPGRQRSPQFGLSYLRLDRDLKAGMLVTIEPGFYWIPALLEDPARTAPFADCLNRDRIQEFREVKGIRIEDEYLVTESGSRCLTDSLPRRAAAVEEMVGAPSR